MKNPFEYIEPAEITKDERKVLAQMFGTPERINILRKAFQLTSNDERGYLMPASIQNFALDATEEDASKVLQDLRFKQEVDRYLKAVLANIHADVSGLYEEQTTFMAEEAKQHEETCEGFARKQSDHEKEIVKLTKKTEAARITLKDVKGKIAEAKVTNDSGLSANL